MWVLRPQVMMEKCSLKQKNQKRCWPRKCRRGQCLCNTMYVIPLVCVGFYLKSGGNIGRCFWPTGSQNHIRKSCRIFPMETETPWKFVIQGFGILWKSYGPIHTHTEVHHWLVTFWGQETLVKDLVLRAQQQGPRVWGVKEDVYHWHPLTCQKEDGLSMCFSHACHVFSISTASNLCTLQDVRQQKLIFLPKMLYYKHSKEEDRWIHYGRWSSHNLCQVKSADHESQTQDEQWQ